MTSQLYEDAMKKKEKEELRTPDGTIIRYYVHEGVYRCPNCDELVDDLSTIKPHECNKTLAA